MKKNDGNNKNLTENFDRKYLRSVGPIHFVSVVFFRIVRRRDHDSGFRAQSAHAERNVRSRHQVGEQMNWNSKRNERPRSQFGESGINRIKFSSILSYSFKLKSNSIEIHWNPLNLYKFGGFPMKIRVKIVEFNDKMDRN